MVVEILHLAQLLSIVLLLREILLPQPIHHGGVLDACFRYLQKLLLGLDPYLFRLPGLACVLCLQRVYDFCLVVYLLLQLIFIVCQSLHKGKVTFRMFLVLLIVVFFQLFEFALLPPNSLSLDRDLLFVVLHFFILVVNVFLLFLDG